MATVYLTMHLKLLCAFPFILFVFLLLVAFSPETLIVFLLGTKHYSTSIHSFSRNYVHGFGFIRQNNKGNT